MKDYEKQIKENQKRNEKFINEFETWLREKNIKDKTIRKHVNNVDLYINNYLNYYDVSTMEEGVNSINLFLDGWFIEKCLWATANSIKETATSIKKFYRCMSEKNYVNVDEYKALCIEIKNNMDQYLASLEAYDDGTYFDMYL